MFAAHTHRHTKFRFPGMWTLTKSLSINVGPLTTKVKRFSQCNKPTGRLCCDAEKSALDSISTMEKARPSIVSQEHLLFAEWLGAGARSTILINTQLTHLIDQFTKTQVYILIQKYWAKYLVACQTLCGFTMPRCWTLTHFRYMYVSYKWMKGNCIAHVVQRIWNDSRKSNILRSIYIVPWYEWGREIALE